MEKLRPYHALLLLQNEKELIESLPLDYNTAVKKVIMQASPLKSFRTLAADTALTKSFVSILNSSGVIKALEMWWHLTIPRYVDYISSLYYI